MGLAPAVKMRRKGSRKKEVKRKKGPGSVDHFTWVTMTGEEPKIANILLEGVVDHTGKKIYLGLKES